MGYFIVIVGFGLLSKAIADAARAVWFEQHSMPTTGKVVDHEIGDQRGRPRFPVVEFRTQNGKKWRFTSDFGANPASDKVGDQLPIRYLKTDPSKARIEKAWRVWWDAVGLGGLGLIITIVGMRFMGIF
ncbi:MAG: DUF3592 domain-containing protein [Pyrinomonadaceae bacterium]